MTYGGPGIPGTGVTGLRRFVKRPSGAPSPGVWPGSEPAEPAGPGPRIPGVGQRTRTADGAEGCEMCREVLGDRHGHVVDLEKRSLSCTCRACYLLFTHSGAAGGRYRSVPERVCYDPDRPLTDADWNELQIPVAVAFFFYNSALGRVVAGYPSPGGVTECELDLAAWDRLAAAYPLLAALAPDVEAIFINRTADGNETFLIPIDRCYSLVGELRLLWQGFDGGEEARTALATFLTRLRERAVALEPQPGDLDLGAAPWPT
ncbi:MAG TPA: DUF5947 family protein [Streptosporangiaceae bacterium]|nr:DUF5947 family protein [Streptosporangiaceae bacterium]